MEFSLYKTSSDFYKFLARFSGMNFENNTTKETVFFIRIYGFGGGLC